MLNKNDFFITKFVLFLVSEKFSHSFHICICSIGQSWFDSHPATEYTEEIIEEVPCVSAGQDSEASVCELCRDKFEQFYNEDIDEWQLRNAIRLDEKIYHPICYQDYKVGSREEIEAEGEPVTENPEEIDDSESLPESETILKVEPDEKLKDTNEVDTTEITKLVEGK